MGRCWEVIHSEVIHSECRWWEGGLPGDGCLPGDGGLPADGGVSLVFFTIGSISGGDGGVVIDFQVNPGHFRERIPERVPKRGREAKFGVQKNDLLKTGHFRS